MKTTNKATETKPITTTESIRALRHEAASAGDVVQVAICDIALVPMAMDRQPVYFVPSYDTLTGSAKVKLARVLRPWMDTIQDEDIGTVQPAARAECARVIAANEEDAFDALLAEVQAETAEREGW